MINRSVINVDESPIPLERWRKYLPSWLKRFLPVRGGRAEEP
ncbi:hypothetical protein [Trichormus azollae]|jgi:cytochrome c oxidase subunit 3